MATPSVCTYYRITDDNKSWLPHAVQNASSNIKSCKLHHVEEIVMLPLAHARLNLDTVFAFGTQLQASLQNTTN